MFAAWIAGNREAFFVSAYMGNTTRRRNGELMQILDERDISYVTEMPPRNRRDNVFFLATSGSTGTPTSSQPPGPPIRSRMCCRSTPDAWWAAVRSLRAGRRRAALTEHRESIPHLHVAPRRVLDRLELAAAGLARRRPRRRRAALIHASQSGHQEPGCSVAFSSQSSSVPVRLAAGPVLVLALARRIDHAGDVAGAGQHELAPARRRISSRGTPISPARCGPRGWRDCRPAS